MFTINDSSSSTSCCDIFDQITALKEKYANQEPTHGFMDIQDFFDWQKSTKNISKNISKIEEDLHSRGIHQIDDIYNVSLLELMKNYNPYDDYTY